MLRILLSCLLVTCSTYGQAPHYEDLMMYYADGNLTKLTARAKKYCKQPSTKKDPLAHLWLARACYKTAIQTHPGNETKYREGLQLAVEEIRTSKQLDSAAVIQKSYGHYYEEISITLIEELLKNIHSDQASIYWINEYRKISPNSTGLTYLESYFYYTTNNQSEAELLQQKADSLIPNQGEFATMNTQEIVLLQQGILLTVSYLNENEQKEKSKALIEKTRHCFNTDINGEIYLPESK